MTKRFLIPLSLAVVLAACNGGGPEQQTGASDSAAPGQQSGKGATMKVDSRLEPYVERATGDLADRLEIDETEVQIAAASFVTWPNGALGCPEPGTMYTQALVPGYRIQLLADGSVYHYHGARDKPPFHCPAERVNAPAADSEASSGVR